MPIRAIPLSVSQSFKGRYLSKRRRDNFPLTCQLAVSNRYDKLQIDTNWDSLLIYVQRTFLFPFSTGLAIQRSEATTCSPVLHTSRTTTGSSSIFSLNPEMVIFQAAKGNQAQAVFKRQIESWIQKNPKVLVSTLTWAGPLTSATRLNWISSICAMLRTPDYFDRNAGWPRNTPPQ